MYNIELPKWVFEENSSDDSVVRLYEINSSTKYAINHILISVGVNNYLVNDATEEIIKAITNG